MVSLACFRNALGSFVLPLPAVVGDDVPRQAIVDAASSSAINVVIRCAVMSVTRDSIMAGGVALIR
jgi:hypothetical protein